MQETEFIAQNKEKWKEFEEVLKSDNKDPDRLTNLFIETTDDLSFSQTHYPNRSVRVYLNSISQRVYQAIYKNKKKAKNRFSNLWKKELPEAIWQSRKATLLSFAIFSIGIIIGVFSDIYYPDFAKIVLSPGYVEMTESYIENGDPMAVYKDSDPIDMFFMIGINNIQISFGAFVLGLLFGLGTLYILFSNGIMFGAFMHFFFARGLWQESVLTVMQHGTLELSMIVMAGSAGFLLAQGLLFPGTYSRLESLIITARSAIKIMIAVFILLVYAAFIESFITRHTDIPNVIRVTSILLSLSIVIGYFVWYPWYRYKNGFMKDVQPEPIPSLRREKIDLNPIKSAGAIFNDTFAMMGKSLKGISLISAAVALIGVITYALLLDGKLAMLFWDGEIISFDPSSILWCWSPYYYILDFERYPFFFFYCVIAFAAIMVLYHRISNRILDKPDSDFSVVFIQIINSLILAVVALLPFQLGDFSSFFIGIFSWPLTMLWMAVSFEENKFCLLTFFKTIQLALNSIGKLLGVFWTVHIMQWFALLLLNGSLAMIISFLLTGRPMNILMLIFEFISMNIPRNAPLAEHVPYMVYTFLLLFALAFLVSLSIYSSILLFYTTNEVYNASSLKESFEKIGIKKRAYGLEKEL
ncbi:MAG: stage II sporulation protein M [Flavobacteriales bacterium]